MRQLIVGCEYDRTVLGKVNPRTGVPCKVPQLIDVLCDEGEEEEFFALLASINASRGWLGETYLKPLYWRGEECQSPHV